MDIFKSVLPVNDISVLLENFNHYKDIPLLVVPEVPIIPKDLFLFKTNIGKTESVESEIFKKGFAHVEVNYLLGFLFFNSEEIIKYRFITTLHKGNKFFPLKKNDPYFLCAFFHAQKNIGLLSDRTTFFMWGDPRSSFDDCYFIVEKNS